ncbi:MAG: threonine--tRNA ligase [Bdellovibrionaceae bacterium]|nr:threonine--tRNA ligase [Pseudobdellovibrionaceae bacterium]
MSVRIILPDHSEKVFDSEPTILQVAESISPRLAKATVGGLLNGEKEIIDLRMTLKDGTRLEIVTDNSERGREVLRHSAAHVMAQAVQSLWPEVKVTIGPVIDNGFYYDFDSPHAFTPDDLPKIEKKMEEFIKKDFPITKEVVTKEDALARFKDHGEKYKIELIEDLPEGTEISIYHQDNWYDLCRGPHVQRSGQIKAIKLMSIAGAYWRGDEKRERLQRIYATAFEDKKALKEHLELLEEAKKRDHRKLGKELNLFTFNDLAPGSPFFTPKGTIIYNQLQNYMREKYVKYGYQEVITPQIYDVDLYHCSGHYNNYKDNMYFTEIDKREFSVKPMNCPGHCLLYASDKKSYRDLPYRIADFGRLHRYERSGVMHGLTRVRTFCQDDAHIFCDIKDLAAEIKSFMSFLDEVYNELGMSEYRIYLSTRPEQRMGSDEVWDRAEGALEAALKAMDLPYVINEGDGAFYGPKLDIMFVDALKRPWQLGTIQCDFNMPEAFNLTFVGAQNSEERPVMLHRAILGSLERFIGVYLEHTAGRLPLWMTPTQIRILNVSEAQTEYCKNIEQALFKSGVRVHFDDRNEKLGFKIREAQLEKVPYMLIIGDQEVESSTISVRNREGKMSSGISLIKWIAMLTSDIENKVFQSTILENLEENN